MAINPGPPPPQFQEVLRLQQTGDVTGAVALCENIIKLVPNHPAAYQFTAMIFCQNGNVPEGIVRLRKAIQLGADTPAMRYNLAKALFENGDVDAAEAELQSLLDRQVFTSNNLCLMGDIHKAKGRFSEAISYYERVLAADQNVLQAWNNLGNTYRLTGQTDKAVIALKNATRIAPDRINIVMNLGLALKEQGQLDDAMVTLQRACELDENNADALTALGEVMNLQGNHADTVLIFQRAIELAPKNAESHFNHGVALAYNGDAVAAIEAFKKAIANRNEYWPAYFNLISQLEKVSRLDEMDEALSTLEKAGVEGSTLPILRASWHRRSGKLETARDILVRTDTSDNEATALMQSALLGQVLDRLGDADGAFRAFVEMNRAEAARPYAQKFDKNVYIDRIRHLTGSFTSANDPAESGDDDVSPVFMVGFPRSGTTLLDTMLRGHENIGVLEEVPIIDDLLDREGRTELYRKLTAEQRANYIEHYLNTVKEHSDDPSKSLWIDKLPLNIGEAGFIHRLFPQARFILSLRHPCDCVLSCFMQQFSINHAMANFVTLEDAARLYDRIMTLWVKYNQELPLQVHAVKYEQLVASPEETICPLLEFLGMSWSDSVLDYQKTAKSRTSINTPSYHQVTEELYTRAIGRWGNYREHMQDVLPILRPWMDHFGYAEE